MKASDIQQHSFSAWRRSLVSLAAVLATVHAHGAPLDDMVALDAIYIPALAMTTAAAQDAIATPRARAALIALRSQWPALRQRLAQTWGAKLPEGWSNALASTGQHIEAAAVAASYGDWKQAHEALEPVRLELMEVRRNQGLDYLLDRLTDFHEPMEVLAQAGSTWQQTALDALHQDRLERAYAHARTLWRRIEGQPVDAVRYGLTPTRAEQLRKAVEEESAALTQLSDAFRAGEGARILKAASAIKPPFARAYTAFGSPASAGER